MRILQVFGSDFAEAILQAVRVLKSGGVIVYPTDTIYGLGVNALDAGAVEKIFTLKHRSSSKPLPIAVKNMIWAKELAHITVRNAKILERIWPGKITAILPKKKIVPDVITAGAPTVGMRIPDHEFVDALLGKFGYPLTATSANISGDAGTGDIHQLLRTFATLEPKPDLIIDAGVLKASEPSTVVDLTGSSPKIVRIGASKPKDLLKLLSNFKR